MAGVRTLLAIFVALIGFCSGTLITISPVQVRTARRLDECAKACLDEKLIKCKYFKFANSTSLCYLSSQEKPNFSKYDIKATLKVDTPVGQIKSPPQLKHNKEPKLTIEPKKKEDAKPKIEPKQKGKVNKNPEPKAQLKLLPKEKEKTKPKPKPTLKKLQNIQKLKTHLNTLKRLVNVVQKLQKLKGTNVNEAKKHSKQALAKNHGKIKSLLHKLRNVKSALKSRDEYNKLKKKHPGLLKTGSPSKKLKTGKKKSQNAGKNITEKNGLQIQSLAKIQMLYWHTRQLRKALQRIKTNQPKFQKLSQALGGKLKILDRRLSNVLKKVKGLRLGVKSTGRKLKKTLDNNKFFTRDNKNIVTALTALKKSLMAVKSLIPTIPQYMKNEGFLKRFNNLLRVVKSFGKFKGTFNKNVKQTSLEVAKLYKRLNTLSSRINKLFKKMAGDRKRTKFLTLYYRNLKDLTKTLKKPKAPASYVKILTKLGFTVKLLQKRVSKHQGYHWSLSKYLKKQKKALKALTSSTKAQTKKLGKAFNMKLMKMNKKMKLQRAFVLSKLKKLSMGKINRQVQQLNKQMAELQQANQHLSFINEKSFSKNSGSMKNFLQLVATLEKNQGKLMQQVGLNQQRTLSLLKVLQQKQGIKDIDSKEEKTKTKKHHIEARKGVPRKKKLKSGKTIRRGRKRKGRKRNKKKGRKLSTRKKNKKVRGKSTGSKIVRQKNNKRKKGRKALKKSKKRLRGKKLKGKQRQNKSKKLRKKKPNLLKKGRKTSKRKPSKTSRKLRRNKKKRKGKQQRKKVRQKKTKLAKKGRKSRRKGGNRKKSRKKGRKSQKGKPNKKQTLIKKKTKSVKTAKKSSKGKSRKEFRRKQKPKKRKQKKKTTKLAKKGNKGPKLIPKKTKLATKGSKRKQIKKLIKKSGSLQSKKMIKKIKPKSIGKGIKSQKVKSSKLSPGVTKDKMTNKSEKSRKKKLVKRVRRRRRRKPGTLRGKKGLKAKQTQRIRIKKKKANKMQAGNSNQLNPGIILSPPVSPNTPTAKKDTKGVPMKRSRRTSTPNNCGKGKFLHQSSRMCLDCPFNTYQDLQSHIKETCTPCPSGLSTTDIASSSVTDCGQTHPNEHKLNLMSIPFVFKSLTPEEKETILEAYREVAHTHFQFHHKQNRASQNKHVGVRDTETSSNMIHNDVEEHLNSVTKEKRQDTAISKVTSCPKQYTAVGSFCFLASTPKVSLQLAATACLQAVGLPITIKSAEKQKAVMQFIYGLGFKSPTTFWIAPVQYQNSGFVWTTDHMPLTYTNFETLPNRADDICLVIDSLTTQWQERSCEHNLKEQSHMLCEPMEMKPHQHIAYGNGSGATNVPLAPATHFNSSSPAAAKVPKRNIDYSLSEYYDYR